ncbi:polymeric immunoglobulin receptor-like isoform X2 [Chanodichthys erythropterus]|uniref:polymeric immunoglobulin receptor-like isoform X2 n=1 Tax=Chanodichthys erythropterus TaxID=933992 RepID=UPI00351E886F
MKIILTFTLLMIPGVVSSISVTGYSGGGVTITCKYDEGYAANKKYFCKGQWSNCTDQIKTDEKDKWVHSGRFSLYDDTRSAVFNVTIRDLKEQDSDTYWCGTERVGKDLYTEVNLEVIRDDCCVKSISLSAAAGGSVNISCKYPQSHISDVKFLCWRSGADLCAEETSVKESRRWSPEGKIQLYDDREEQLLTGSISHVTEQDSEYWCGVQSDQGHKSFITRVLIHVTETNDLNTPYPSSSSSSSVKTQMITEMTLTSLDTTSTITGSAVIFISVLVLLLIGVLMFLVAVRKNKEAHGFSGDEVTHVSCSYVTVSKTDLHSDLNHTDTRTTVVYSAVHLPINPSD